MYIHTYIYIYIRMYMYIYKKYSSLTSVPALKPRLRAGVIARRV